MFFGKAGPLSAAGAARGGHVRAEETGIIALVSSVVFSYTVTFDSGTNAEQSQEQQRWPKAMDTTTLEELVCFG